MYIEVRCGMQIFIGTWCLAVDAHKYSPTPTHPHSTTIDYFIAADNRMRLPGRKKNQTRTDCKRWEIQNLRSNCLLTLTEFRTNGSKTESLLICRCKASFSLLQVKMRLWGFGLDVGIFYMCVSLHTPAHARSCPVVGFLFYIFLCSSNLTTRLIGVVETSFSLSKFRTGFVSKCTKSENHLEA